MDEQATVYSVAGDGSVTLLRDDGLLVDADAEAVTEGGWRTLRQGQRVAVRRSADGRVVSVSRPV
ncbi:cold-shock protein [Solihabitans fulvus]|uniref:Cold-shock protein n=1 Tax=Solihabitans fulvus TaxID=1892852 RepID=A0A5B2WPX9_9PSEU|nr:cold-shock protein [Solihabitans fulvus]KAA2253535.1 cold-shock protein [Solihabitans fulvus]